ncbi:MAG: HAMP domain-containing sensor histidine kinase [Tepidiformaceae bacterium]
MRLPPLLPSLQSKLIAAFVSVTVIALALAGAVFIVVRRDDQERSQLDHVAASAPQVLGDFGSFYKRTHGEDGFDAFVHDTASRHGVRVMLVTANGKIVSDSENKLIGQELNVPANAEQQPGPGDRVSYTTWSPSDGQPGAGFVLVASNVPAGVPFARAGLQADGARLVLGVPQSTIANAWQALLPGLGIAALFALPVAILLAILFARYITRPVKQLTLASRQMTSGTFDIDVPSGRRDELGELATAFETMAQHVGDSQTQMRTLVANVSHDLKTPLTSILGFARALHTGAASSDDAAHLGGIIEEEAQRLAVRLNDLLLLSELDSGKALVEQSHVDVGALTAGVARRLLGDADRQQITVHSDTPTGLIALADGPKLERAVENLVGNARKFTPAGGTITLRVFQSADLPVQIRMEVANTCEPVPPEELDQLFDRFYRRDRSRTARTPGSGLGLSIARELVQLQQGSLRADSRKGMIVFTVALPAAGAEPDLAGASAAARAEVGLKHPGPLVEAADDLDVDVLASEFIIH